jgi:hypothetical protein
LQFVYNRTAKDAKKQEFERYYVRNNKTSGKHNKPDFYVYIMSVINSRSRRGEFLEDYSALSMGAVQSLGGEGETQTL